MPASAAKARIIDRPGADDVAADDDEQRRGQQDPGKDQEEQVIPCPVEEGNISRREGQVGEDQA